MKTFLYLISLYFQGAESKKHVAVMNNTFSVRTGEILGLLGPNGAGKTTTLNMILAEVTPSRGQVHITFVYKTGCEGGGVLRYGIVYN